MSTEKQVVYIVTRKGVYDQGLLGVFATEADARAAAERATTENKPSDPHGLDRDRDGDGWHDFRLEVSTVGEYAPPREIARWTATGLCDLTTGHAPYAWSEVVQ